MSNFGGQSPKEHSCIIISKSMHWLRRRSHLKVFLFLALGAILFILSGRLRAILVDSHLRNLLVKLFQNLSTNLAEEVVKSLFLFIALVAILFNVAESFEKFWWRVTQETFLYNYFKIHLLVQGRSRLKVFFLFLALAAILVKRCGGVSAILVEGHPRNLHVKLFPNQCTG